MTERGGKAGGNEQRPQDVGNEPGIERGMRTRKGEGMRSSDWTALQTEGKCSVTDTGTEMEDLGDDLFLLFYFVYPATLCV